MRWRWLQNGSKHISHCYHSDSGCFSGNDDTGTLIGAEDKCSYIQPLASFACLGKWLFNSRKRSVKNCIHQQTSWDYFTEQWLHQQIQCVDIYHLETRKGTLIKVFHCQCFGNSFDGNAEFTKLSEWCNSINRAEDVAWFHQKLVNIWRRRLSYWSDSHLQDQVL